MSFMSRSLVAAGLTLVAFAQPAVARDASYDTSRVVAIGGSITEIIYALGAEDRLIARDSTSMYPEAALELPDVGYMRQLSPEGVLSVDPSLIIALEGSGPPEAVEVLEKASVPMVEVPERFDREGILEKIRVVGETLGLEDKAAKLADKVGADIASAEHATDGVSERKRVLFILSVQGGRILASGTGTAAAGIIDLAGAENAVTDYPGYKQLTDEAVIAAAPDMILMMSRGDTDHGANVDELLKHPAIASTPAGKSRNVVRMDGAFLLGFGPRTAEAVGELSQTLYGDVEAGG